MPEHYPLLIQGAKATGQLEVFAPYDNTLIGVCDSTDAKGVDLALKTANDLYYHRSHWIPLPQRLAILEKAILIMQSRAEELALEAAREGGKPLNDSRVEVARAIDGIKICIETMRTTSGREIPMNLNAASSNRFAVTRLHPIGVVVAVSAFNHPINLIVHQAAPAIAAGCPVIVKPAEDTPLSCIRFAKILYEAGIPPEWCQVILCDSHDTTQQLISDPRVSFFSFIGSASIGWMLRSKLAAGTRCALEHGGVAPLIVTQDADIDSAIPLIAKGGFYHAGQVCVSVQKVFVHESLAEILAQKLADFAKKLKVGDPTKPETEIGPLIRHKETDRIHEWVNEAVQSGAKLLCGGKKISDSCYESTVLYNPPATAKVSNREIFGPVISVYPFAQIDEAIERANSLPFAFQTAVFTKEIETALHCYAKLEASTVLINDHTAFRVDWMPFAGLKQSGLGVGGIQYSIRDMQIEKLLIVKSPRA